MKALYTIIFSFLLTASFAQNWRYNYYDLWSANSWQNNSQQISVYHSDGRLDSLFGNNYQNDSYLPFSSSNFNYNSDLQLLEKTTATLIGEIQRQKSIYTYNPEGKLATQIDQELVNGSWNEINKSVLSYNASGELLMKIDQSPQGNGVYTALYKLENSYGVNEKLLESTFSVFESGVWSPIEKITYSYNSNEDIAGSLSQYLVEGVWINSRNHEYSYTPDNLLLSVRTDRWNENEAWENYMKSDFTYNNDHVKNQEIVSTWEDGWKNFSRRRFENDPSVLSLSDLESQFNVFPNPVNDRLTIASDNNSFMNITFIDVTGKNVLSVEKTPETNVVSTENLPSGVYNVVFSTEKGSFIKRVVKI